MFGNFHLAYAITQPSWPEGKSRMANSKAKGKRNDVCRRWFPALKEMKPRRLLAYLFVHLISKYFNLKILQQYSDIVPCHRAYKHRQKPLIHHLIGLLCIRHYNKIF